MSHQEGQGPSVEVWELVARESIRDLVARYNAAGDSGRIAQMIELFGQDARLVVPDGSHEGREAIRAFFESVASGAGQGEKIRLLRHFTATHQIDVLGPESATGRCYYQVLTEAGLDHWGVYVDRYDCAEDRWLFQERRVRVDGMTPGGWAEGRLRS
jgi:uncharacterized protein (TIGR02246 family)